jgi:hypothetical protein
MMDGRSWPSAMRVAREPEKIAAKPAATQGKPEARAEWMEGAEESARLWVEPEIKLCGELGAEATVAIQGVEAGWGTIGEAARGARGAAAGKSPTVGGGRRTRHGVAR